MGELPVDLIYDILSRLPVKSLDRFRCACKTWCNYIHDPNLAILHLKRAPEEPLPIMINGFLPPGPELSHTVTLSSIIIKSNEDYKEVQNKSVFQFECNEPLCNIHIVQGSCNGLLYLLNYSYKSQTTFYVIHPLRKERYELPPIFSVYTCGLGFDTSTNTFKMCVWDGDHKAIRNWTPIEIVGLWNKSGDILVSADGETRLFVYSRKSQDFHEIKVVGWED